MNKIYRLCCAQRVHIIHQALFFCFCFFSPVCVLMDEGHLDPALLSLFGDSSFNDDDNDEEFQGEELREEFLAMFAASAAKGLVSRGTTAPRNTLPSLPENITNLDKKEKAALLSEFVKDTKRVVSTSARATRDREAYAEKALLYKLSKDNNNFSPTLRNKLELLAAQTRPGAKVYPELAKLTSTLQGQSDFIQSSALAMAQLGRAHRKRVCQIFLQNVSNEFAKKELLLTEQDLKHIRDKRVRGVDKDNIRRQDVLLQDMILNVTRLKITEPEEQVLMLFFTETTSILSGQATLTRNLEMTQTDWGFELFSRYPRYLHALACSRPELLEDGTMTKFRAELRAAVALYKQPDFDAEAHVDLRRSNIRARYVAQQWNLKGWTASPIPELSDCIQGVGYDTFLKVIDRAGCKWTKFTAIHPCDLCDNYEFWQRRFEAVTALLASKVEANGNFDDSSEDVRTLIQSKKRFHGKLDECRLHILQLVACRAQAEKMRENMPPGHVFVTRDYVNHHDHGGAHVKCLHLVLQWRETAGAPLKLLKIRNYCSDPDSMKTDMYFTRL